MRKLVLSLIALALLLNGFDLAVPSLIGVLCWVVATTTRASGAAYVWVTVRG